MADEDFCRQVVYERIALGAVPALNHLAWALVHKVLESEQGFGGCSCDDCSLLRESMTAIREKEAQEYGESLGTACGACGLPSMTLANGICLTCDPTAGGCLNSK